MKRGIFSSPENNVLWGGLALYFIICIVSLTLFDKLQIALFINNYHSLFWDAFFKNYTFIGTFTVIGPVLVFLLFVRFRFVLIACISTLLASGLAQLVKRLDWTESMRPVVYLEKIKNVHFVDGEYLNILHSFPSGHTAGAFSLLVTLALIAKSPFVKLFFLISAVMVAYSRMYLLQHFLVDVTFGALIGTTSAILIYAWFTSPSWNKRKSLEKSLYGTLGLNKLMFRIVKD
jgi:membrane-associated phospholipid phosphatase